MKWASFENTGKNIWFLLETEMFNWAVRRRKRRERITVQPRLWGIYPEGTCGTVEILLLLPEKFTRLNAHCLQKQVLNRDPTSVFSVKCLRSQTTALCSHPGANINRVAWVRNEQQHSWVVLNLVFLLGPWVSSSQEGWNSFLIPGSFP